MTSFHAFVPASLLALAAVVLASDQDSRTAPPSVKVADLSFMTGAWRMTRGPMEIEETWIAPKAGAMFGVSRTTMKDTTVEFEFLRIEDGKDGAVYVAQPGGRAPTRFKVTEATADSVAFENPAHDFPTKIAYSKTEGGGLKAVVSGPGSGGKPRRLTFDFVRA